MKAKAFANGSAILLVLAIGLDSTASGRIQLHGHQHGDVLGRILHKPKASSGSSILGTATDRETRLPYLVIATLTEGTESVASLPNPTEIVNDARCFGAECDLLNVTNRLHVSPRITSVPQVQVKDLELRDPQLSNRRRQRSRVSAPTDSENSSTSIELDSFSSGAVTEPTSTDSKSISNLQRDAINVDKASKSALVQGAEDHGFPAFGIPNFHRPNHLAPRQDDGYQSFMLGGFSSPSSTGSVSAAMASVTAYGGKLPTTLFIPPSSSPVASSTTKSVTSSASTASGSTASSVCPAGNGTIYTSAAGINYQIVCNTDYEDNNFPFQLVHSFADCLQKCDAWNYDHHDIECVAAIHVPNRDADDDDCYLKSKLVDPSAASGYSGALRIGYASITSSAAAASSSLAISSSAVAASTSVSSSIAQTSASSSTRPTTSSSSVSSPGVTYASGKSVIVPNVSSSYLQGPSQNTPTQQYLDIKAPAGVTLASSLLTVGDNGDLTTGYDISGQTGVLDVNISTQSYLRPLTNTPHLSRDGGRGGMVNGEHLFVFCDTGSYSTTTSSSNGNFLGFVSSSVATDVGMKGLTGSALNLEDGIGQWSDNTGRMRGFAPLTEGEMAYNQIMQGQGQRYAVWPEADIIPLDAKTGIMYAPIVYDNVNELTKAAVFTYTGATLLTITAGGKGGPVAQRTVEKIFQKDEIEWGCSGGIRSWGPSGIGGDDGNVYLFGNVQGGVLLARVPAAHVADRNYITYWNGASWTNNMLTKSSTSYFIEGAFIDLAVFYSPRHLTFIIVYLTFYADSTFYYRYLEADQGILPPFAPGGDSSSDYVENILKYKWSEQQVLYKASPGLSGKYIYSGGPHLGYYGSNDIINGGTKMLLSWTAPTGLDPSTFISEYQLLTAEIDWA